MTRCNSQTFHYLTSILLVGLCLYIASCGGSSDGDNTAIVNMHLENNPVARGAQTVLSTDFSYSANDVFDEEHSVILVFQLSPEVSAVVGSTEIDAIVEPDHSVGALGTTCPDGSSFILFNLDENDLIRATNPSGNADGRLKMTVQTLAGPAIAHISALSRRDSYTVSCGDPFETESIVSLTIV